jgi:hypothetical protein
MIVVTIQTETARWYLQRVEAERALFTTGINRAYRFGNAHEAHEARESQPFMRALEQEFDAATVAIERAK